jgi:hypothetical protein
VRPPRSKQPNPFARQPAILVHVMQGTYQRSASTAAPWTYWNKRNQSAFAELKYDLGHDWSVKGVYTFNRIQYKAKLLYADGTPDPVTGLWITGVTGLYPPTTSRTYSMPMRPAHSGCSAASMMSLLAPPMADRAGANMKASRIPSSTIPWSTGLAR